MKKNLFKEIIFWAHDKTEGFTMLDIQNKFNLTNEELEHQLIRLIPRYINDLMISGKTNLLILTGEGIGKYLEMKKPWHEKPIGKVIFIIIGAIVGIIIKEFWSYLASF